MLDVKFICENADRVQKNTISKNERHADIDGVVALKEKSRKLQLSVDEARTKINAISKEIGTIKKTDPKSDVSAKQAESRAIGDAIKKSEEEMKALDLELEKLLHWIPNMAHESVPVGEDLKSNKHIKTFGRALRPLEVTHTLTSASAASASTWLRVRMTKSSAYRTIGYPCSAISRSSGSR